MLDNVPMNGYIHTAPEMEPKMGGHFTIGRLQLRGLLDAIRDHALRAGAPPEHVQYVEHLKEEMAPRPRNLPPTDEEREKRKATTAVALRALALRLHRTPTKNDIAAASRDNEIVWPSVIQKDFGSLAAAMTAAGVEPRIPGHSVEDSGFGVDRTARRQPTNYRPLRGRGWTACGE
jgi:hypothetical protein